MLILKLPTMKLLCFLSISSFFITIQSSAFSATKTVSNMDIEAILRGIKHYNSLTQSGEADMTHIMIQKGAPMAEKVNGTLMNGTYKYHFMFDQNKMRMDMEQDQKESDRFRRHTYIYFTGQWEWEISEQHVNGKSSILYIYNTTVRSKFEQRDPRDYGEFDRDRFLNKNDFRIKGQEKINNIVCYVLENKDGTTRFWIAPEQGFRVLKTEYEYSLGPHKEDGKETYGIERNFISYEKYGEAWFPKAVDHKIYYIDKKGQKQLMTHYKTEAKNIRLNHQIPKEKFAIDLQHDADEIKVFLANSDEVLTKEQFIERYDSLIKSSKE